MFNINKERTYEFNLEGLALAMGDKPNFKRFLEDNPGIDALLTIAIIVSSATLVHPVSIGYTYKIMFAKSLLLKILTHF